VVALNHFFDLEATYQAAPNGQDAAFFNQKKLNKELTAAQRVMGRLGGKKKPNQLDVQKLILKKARRIEKIAGLFPPREC